MGGAGRRLAVLAVLGLLAVAIGWGLRRGAEPVPTGSPPTVGGVVGPDTRPAIAPPDPAPTPSAALETGSPDAGGEPFEEIPELLVAAPPASREIFTELGLERDLDAWMARHTVPWDRAVQTSYEGFTKAELRRLAAEDDAIARWVLARRLLYTAPLEANDLLRGLAEDGVIPAIGRLHTHLRGLVQHYERLADRWSEDTRAAMEAWEAAGTDLPTEALAWGLLAETYDGLPRGTGVDPGLDVRTDGQRLPDLKAACERASELRAGLASAWAEDGRPDVAVEPSPVVHTVSPKQAYLEACPAELLPTPSFEGCRPFRMRGGGFEGETMYACPDP